MLLGVLLIQPVLAIVELVVPGTVQKNQNKDFNCESNIMRRRRPERRQILPDPVYNDKMVAKFVNYIMTRGKKGVAEKIFYGAMDMIKQRTKTDGIAIFEKAIENTSPAVEVKSRRIGGATYQVPIEVPKGRRFYLASQWIIKCRYRQIRKANV